MEEKIVLWMLFTSITRSQCKNQRTYKICKQSLPTDSHGYLPKKKDCAPPVDNNKKLMTSNFAMFKMFNLGIYL